MASGHMNRVKRPDTWLHRPMLQNVKKVLANPEPSTHDPGCVKTRILRVAGRDRSVLGSRSYSRIASINPPTPRMCISRFML
jgi:hypothetical protein